MPNLNFNDFVGDKEKNERNTAEFSDKNPLITAFLCLFLGFWGLHSFYVGRSNSGKFRLALGLLCVLLAIVRIKLGYLFVLLALLLSLIDFLKIAKGEYRDVDDKIIQVSGFGVVTQICSCYFIFVGIAAIFLFDSEPKVSDNNTQVTQTSPKDVPANEKTFEALYKCKFEKDECAAEYNRRLEIGTHIIDSIYAKGDVREVIKLSQMFYNILQSDGSTISFEEIFPTKKGIEKRIDNLLPQKGCIQDSLQYANYLSTIYGVEDALDIDDETWRGIIKKYFSYLNRNCKLLHYDANVVITEERFVRAALNHKYIASTKANALFNDIFKKIDEGDFAVMKSMNEGKSYKGYGVVEKKKNRTISYIEAPSKEFNDDMALVLAAFKVFSFEAYFPFTLHPSVENVEIGFNISELEYDWYTGYYHGIYAVTIKTNKKTLDRYYEKNNIKPPKSIKSNNAMSDEDKNFFAQSPSYSDIKRWCNKNGFVCSKYLVERTR